MGAYDTRAQRQAIYDQYAASLRDMVRRCDEHASTNPGCGAAPLCIDGAVMEDLETLFGFQPDAAVLYLAVAVNELARAGRREQALMRRLEIQRGLTESSARAADELTQDRDRLLDMLGEQAANGGAAS